jgi:hypothetical protein
VLRTNGAPPGYTGAPIDENLTCDGCHSGGIAQGGAGTPFYITASPPEYSPGSSVEITVTIDEPGQAYYSPGFQVTAIQENAHAGDFVIVDEDYTQFAPEGGGEFDERYVTHRNPNEDTRSWTVVWEPGNTDNDVVFHASGLSLFQGITYTDALVVPRASTVNREDERFEIPQVSALHTNYPNPFGQVTVIPFELSEASEIKLSVFDVAGREVDVLASGWFPAGVHQRVFRAEGYPSGTYMYKLSGTAGEHARKMLHIR